MLTPSQLGLKPNVKRIALPDYDFDLQSRRMPVEMSFTANSVQTFNYNGQPSDARNDNTD